MSQESMHNNQHHCFEGSLSLSFFVVISYPILCLVPICVHGSSKNGTLSHPPKWLFSWKKHITQIMGRNCPWWLSNKKWFVSWWRDSTGVKPSAKAWYLVLVSRMVSKAGQLIYSLTTNLAENWTHIWCKFDGGKVSVMQSGRKNDTKLKKMWEADKENSILL